MKYKVYAKETGEVPYKRWISRLRDGRTERLHDRSLTKVTLGNTSHCKQIKTDSRLFEITIDYGPGYRIYCTWIDDEEFLVLNAGLKNTQQNDIDKASEYLADYRKRQVKEKKP